jgi:hypothetical protein
MDVVSLRESTECIHKTKKRVRLSESKTSVPPLQWWTVPTGWVPSSFGDVQPAVAGAEGA